jgi:hypothetical protein
VRCLCHRTARHDPHKATNQAKNDLP